MDSLTFEEEADAAFYSSDEEEPVPLPAASDGGVQYEDFSGVEEEVEEARLAVSPRSVEDAATRVQRYSRCLEKLSFGHLLLSIVASLSYLTPGYNVGLGVWALFAAAHPTPRLLLTFDVFLLISIVLDVTWLACYIVPIFRSISHGITATGNIYHLGMALVVANSLLKLATLFVGHRMFVVLGGHRLVAAKLNLESVKDGAGGLRARIARGVDTVQQHAKRRGERGDRARMDSIELQEASPSSDDGDAGVGVGVGVLGGGGGSSSGGGAPRGDASTRHLD
jgi:hypothetical protein